MVQVHMPKDFCSCPPFALSYFTFVFFFLLVSLVVLVNFYIESCPPVINIHWAADGVKSYYLMNMKFVFELHFMESSVSTVEPVEIYRSVILDWNSILSISLTLLSRLILIVFICRCVGIFEHQAIDIEIYHCPKCQITHGPLKCMSFEVSFCIEFALSYLCIN